MGKKQKYLSKKAKEVEQRLEQKYGKWVKEKDLGAIYTPEKTEFNIFASGVEDIKLDIYEREKGKDSLVEQVDLENAGKNFYTTEMNGNLEGKLYRLTVKRNGQDRMAIDPYAKGVVENGDKGIIIEPSDINPEGWDEDSYQELEKNVDAVLYETHVQDFTNSPSSGAEHKGKYLGMTEEGLVVPGTDISTGIDHLKEMGITHVQLMPIFENGSAVETDENSYNWGYDPENFMVPEGSYSEDPKDPKKRIIEVKKMVQKLHENGIGVVKDTVLNHTYVLGRNSLHQLAADKFFRCTNGSGCGNEIASENPIVQKYMLDDLKHWQEEYHVDGFRFDLMALHNKDTMEAIEKELEAENPSVMLYGEPWKALGSELDSPEKDAEPMDREHQINSGIGAFDDKARDGIKGSPDGHDRGYVTGDIMENRHHIKDIITGEIDVFKGEPGEVIAYTTCHDGNTLYEKICKSAEELSEKDKKKASKLANSIILTSQAVPMIHSGAEMLRTREFDENPYKGPAEKNQIDWNKKAENPDISEYYSGLIHLRKEHPAFRIGDSESIRDSIGFFDDIESNITPEGAVGFELVYDEDEWDNIVVVHNPYHGEAEVELPFETDWKVVVDGEKAGTETLEHVEGDRYSVQGLSTAVLHS